MQTSKVAICKLCTQFGNCPSSKPWPISPIQFFWNSLCKFGKSWQNQILKMLSDPVPFEERENIRYYVRDCLRLAVGTGKGWVCIYLPSMALGCHQGGSKTWSNDLLLVCVPLNALHVLFVVGTLFWPLTLLNCFGKLEPCQAGLAMGRHSLSICLSMESVFLSQGTHELAHPDLHWCCRFPSSIFRIPPLFERQFQNLVLGMNTQTFSSVVSLTSLQSFLQEVALFSINFTEVPKTAVRLHCMSVTLHVKSLRCFNKSQANA